MPRGRGRRSATGTQGVQTRQSISQGRGASTAGRGEKRSADVLEDLVDPRAIQSDADIWVLRDSIPYWAGERARQYGSPNLSVPGRTIDWLAGRGLRWSSLCHEIETKVLL